MACEPFTSFSHRYFIVISKHLRICSIDINLTKLRNTFNWLNTEACPSSPSQKKENQQKFSEFSTGISDSHLAIHFIWPFSLITHNINVNVKTEPSTFSQTLKFIYHR